jgi:hypothetical protein
MASPAKESLQRLLTHENGNGLVHVSTPLLLATAIPLVIMAMVGHHIDPGLADSLGVGVIRSFVQLMMLGVILNPIFKWGMDRPVVVGLCEYSRFVDTIYLFPEADCSSSFQHLQTSYSCL